MQHQPARAGGTEPTASRPPAGESMILRDFEDVRTGLTPQPFLTPHPLLTLHPFLESSSATWRASASGHPPPLIVS